MEFAFENWNRRVRLILERLFRSQFVYAVSITIQGFLILIVLTEGVSAFFLCSQVFIVVFAIVFTIKMFKLIRIKNKEQYREWTRKDSFFIAEANANEALSLNDNQIGLLGNGDL